MNKLTPVELFLARLAKSGRTSLRSQLSSVSILFDWQAPFSDQPFHTMNFMQIEYVKQQKLEQGKSARTINLLIFALKSIVKIALLMGLIDDTQWRQIQAIKRLPVNPSSRGKALHSSMITKLIRYCDQDTSPIGKRDSCILAIFLSTGLRRFELAQLTTDDINLKTKTLIVKSGKGKKPRLQPLPAWALTYIRSWLEIRTFQHGQLFNPIWKGSIKIDKPLSGSTLYKVVKARTFSAIQIDISPHDLRRTFITELLSKNVDLGTVSKLAGHSNITTTQIYDKRDESVMRNAIDLLSYE